MRVVDAQDPANPIEVGAFEPGPGHEAWSVASYGPYALLGHLDNGIPGLDVVDVQDPATPVEVGHCDLPGLPRQIAVWGDEAYVADDDLGMRVIDVCLPEDPVEIGHYISVDRVFGVAVYGDYVYLANYPSGGGSSNGLYVVEVSDPTTPVSAGSYSSSGQAWDVAVWGDLVVLANKSGGVSIFEECGGSIFADGFESGDVDRWSAVVP